MPDSLNMATELLHLAQTAAKEGRRPEAIRTLTRLLGRRLLPDPIVEQGHALLGELYLQENRYSRARRHLAIALVRNSRSAVYHFLMARALDWDEQASDDDALDHYRQALALDPDNPVYGSAYGLLLTYTGQTAEGLERLRAAADKRPQDLELRYNLCVGLINAGHLDRARAEVTHLLQQHPHDAAFLHLQAELARLAQGRPEAQVPVVANIVARRRELDWCRRQEAKPIGPKTGLSTALSRLPAHWCKAIASAVGLPPGDSAAGLRTAIVAILHDADRLRQVVEALPDRSRRALRFILDRGGWTTIEQLRAQFPDPDPATWWWQRQPPTSPLGRLRLAGLVFVGAMPLEDRATLVAVVQCDLREELQAVLTKD